MLHNRGNHMKFLSQDSNAGTISDDSNKIRTYAVECSKSCSPAIHRRRTQLPTPVKKRATTVDAPSRSS